MTDQPPFSVDVSHAFTDGATPPEAESASVDESAGSGEWSEVAESERSEPAGEVDDADQAQGSDEPVVADSGHHEPVNPDIPSMADLDALSADLDDIDAELARMDARATAGAEGGDHS